METLTPELWELANGFGVATEWWDWQGQHHVVPASTVRAVLAGLGVDTTTPEAARESVEHRRRAYWLAVLPACVVMRESWTPWIRVHVPHGRPVELWIELEQGGMRHDVRQQERWVPPQEFDGVLIGEATFQLPGDLPLGWHVLKARSDEMISSSVLIVTPAWVGLPERLRDRRTWGLMTQLYSVRSSRSWGLGDLNDLADLAGWSAREVGAGFVLINPLQAAQPLPPLEPSPYLPATRRFVNPIYLRVEDIPEYAYLPAADRITVEALAAGFAAANRADAQLDRDAAWVAKLQALALVHAVPRTPGRAAALKAFRREQGQGLEDFATWCALAEEHGLPWQDWPEALHDVRSPEVAAAREALRDRVDFYSWLQWVLDEQLAVAQQAARDGGMPVGIVHDLAVGVHSEGADAWTLRSVLAQHIGVGAPPDAFNQQGQDWKQPPWRPDMLAELAYAPYRDMLRTILRHAGGIRVDHVIGLFRLWWVPEGVSPQEGTYVRYDHEALIGILALEAVRARALVIGEDLGTVEPWARDYLAERGILGTSILWFERDHSTSLPLAPERWRELCLATVTTHDLPPTAGYLLGEHIRIRDELGLLTRSIEDESAADHLEQQSWLEAVRRYGLLRPGGDEREIIEALHRFLTLTPSRLIGVSLADAVGDRRAMNQPGTTDEYPNWRVPLADGAGKPLLLDEVVAMARVRSLAAVVSSR